MLTTVGGTTEQWVDEAPGALAAALLQAGPTDLASAVRSQPAVVSPSGLPPTDPPDGGTSGWAGELGGARALASPHGSPFPPWSGSDPAPWELEEEWSRPARTPVAHVDDFPYATPVEAPLSRP